VPRSLISYIETGRSFPKPERLEEFARLFSVDLASLFFDLEDARHRIAATILATDDASTLAMVERLLETSKQRI